MHNHIDFLKKVTIILRKILRSIISLFIIKFCVKIM